jgi:hypothetical protein
MGYTFARVTAKTVQGSDRACCSTLIMLVLYVALGIVTLLCPTVRHA